MEHRLAGVGVAVEDRAETARRVAALGGERGTTPDHPADKAVVLGRQVVQRRHVRARYDEHVHRRLRIDVGEGDELGVFIHARRRDLAGDDATEETHGGKNTGNG